MSRHHVHPVPFPTLTPGSGSSTPLIMLLNLFNSPTITLASQVYRDYTLQGPGDVQTDPGADILWDLSLQAVPGSLVPNRPGWLLLPWSGLVCSGCDTVSLRFSVLLLSCPKLRLQPTAKVGPRQPPGDSTHCFRLRSMIVSSSS